MHASTKRKFHTDRDAVRKQKVQINGTGLWQAPLTAGDFGTGPICTVTVLHLREPDVTLATTAAAIFLASRRSEFTTVISKNKRKNSEV